MNRSNRERIGEQENWRGIISWAVREGQGQIGWPRQSSKIKRMHAWY